MQSFIKLGLMVFIFESFLSWHDFLSFRYRRRRITVSTISNVYDCNAGIALAETRLCLDKRIQAVGTYYATKNAVETVIQLKF